MNARSMSVLSLEAELPNLEIDNSQVKSIQIPLNDSNYDFYQLIESINYVPLETNAESLLGHIDKTLSDKDFVARTDKFPITYKGSYPQTDNTLCVFVSEEKFIRPILYSKQSGNVLKGSAFNNTQHKLFEFLSANIFDFSDGDNFIKVLQPFDIYRIIKLNKKINLSEKEKDLLSKTKRMHN